MQPSHPNSRRRPTAVAFLLACALPVGAVAAQSAPKRPADQPQVAATPAPAPAPAPTLAPPPAAPAKVTFADGQITVNAQNSDLSAILQQIGRTTGISIEGLGKSTRVFGVYGPASPRDVLTDLLAGSGYNFVLLGGGNGSAPAKLVLSEKTAGPLPSANGAPAAADDADSDDADQEPLGPGAIPHPSPQFTDDSDPQTRAQRNLERLQQMHEQMLQQQQQQQQANPQD
jgi:hypothetical protein